MQSVVKYGRGMSEEDRDNLCFYLASRAHEYHCGEYLFRLSGVERVRLYQELETERIRDKYHRLIEYYRLSKNDWRQAMFVVLMRTMGDKYNKEQYMDLAFRVGYGTLLKEREKIEDIEALLIASAGLFGLLPIDEFTDSLRKRGAFLLHKYEIRSMHISQWQDRKVPVTMSALLRILLVAQLIHSHGMLYSQLLACRNREDIISLFDASLRKEWLKYFGKVRERRISILKRDLIGVNVVIPMLYTVGHYLEDESMTDAASDLNESLPAESNFYITAWRKRGLNPTVVYETQALIHLGSLYCRQSDWDKKRRRMGEDISSECNTCPVFKHMCSGASILNQMPAFLER